MTFFHHLYTLLLDSAPWLVLGLLAAGLIKSFELERGIARWLGGRGFAPVARAAILGAPLPLCSCGVLPAALALRRNGASKGATISFLIATPETGVDSVALSYALLGPLLTVMRPVAAIISAMFAGLLVLGTDPSDHAAPSAPPPACTKTNCCAKPPASPLPVSWRKRMMTGLGYAFGEILDDLALWLGLGLVVAALVQTLIPPASLAAWGGGWPAMLTMLLIGIPMYICATASTPLAAGLMLTGLSPGAALVFLLAGPATNMATLALVRREMGLSALAAYLTGITLGSLAFGFLTDALAHQLGWVAPIPGQAAEWIPTPLAAACALLLLVFALRPAWQDLGRFLGQKD